MASNPLMQFLGDVREYARATGKDLSGTAHKIEQSVEHFLINKNLVKGSSVDGSLMVANEALNTQNLAQQFGASDLEGLVKDCEIPEDKQVAAMEQIGIILFRHAGAHRASDVWSRQNSVSTSMENNGKMVGMESFFPESIMSIYSGEKSASLEAFGVNIDSALPDMKMAITVTLLRFHVGLVPRVLPVRGIAQPNVTYVKDSLEIYDLGADIDAPVKRLIDMYADPSMIENNLSKIVPLLANDVDAEGGPMGRLVADGQIKFNHKVNLLKLAVDADKYGLTRVNRTDIVADGARVAAVGVKVDLGDGEKTILVDIPSTRGTLTRPSQAVNASIREGNVDYTILVRKGMTYADGTAITALAGVADAVADTQGIAIHLSVKPTLSLISSECQALGAATVKGAFSTLKLADGTDYDAAVKAAGTAAVASGATLEYYIMDARRSEENLRATTIALRTMRQPFSFDIPTGRNYVYDYAIGQMNAEENAENLTKTIRIGQDWKVLKIIIAKLEEVYNAIQLYKENPLEEGRDPGVDYVAGAKVRPYVFMDTLQLDKIQTVQDANRSGDIKQHVLTYLTAVTTEILQQSYLQQQLPNSSATFKLITSVRMIGNIIGAPHIHNHLSKEDGRDVGDGIEYRLVLPNGVTLECVTTTFEEVRNKIIIIPTVKGNIESELNFAHNWDYGTMVAQYTPSGDAAWHRVFANARELPFVTNPIGALIDVTGIDQVTFFDGSARSQLTVNVANAADFPTGA